LLRHCTVDGIDQRVAQALLDIALHGKSPRPWTIKVDGPTVVRGSTDKPSRGML